MSTRTFASLAFAGALALALHSGLRAGSDEAVGTPLAAEDLEILVGQTGCPLNTNLVSAPSCFVAKTSTGCIQSFNGITGWMNCCTAASIGGGLGCSSQPSYGPGTTKARVRPLSTNCATENVESCYCGWSGTCYSSYASGNVCGTVTSQLPSC